MTIAAEGRLPDRPQDRPGPRRIDLVDVARGAALVAMVVYHFAWDLSFYRLIATDIVARVVAEPAEMADLARVMQQ